jgi:two-component system KDP operon response regulator KdpE
MHSAGLPSTSCSCGSKGEYLRYDSGMPSSPSPGRVTILVVDDEPPIRRVVKSAVAAHANRVVEATTGREGIDLAAAEQPSLIVLDLGLPDMSGEDVCRSVRGWSTAPIVVLSARHSDDEKVALLNAGADDYVTKPFSTSEFQARVAAHLRRAAIANKDAGSPRIELDGLVIDLAQRSVIANSKRVHLTPIEWELLRVLATSQGRTLTHAQLFSNVWKRAEGDAQQYLRVHVASLRRKLELDPVRPRFIHTEPGVGYRFGPED